MVEGIVEGVEVLGHVGTYVGEVNEDGQAHGHGKQTNEENQVYGIFYKNKANGFCTKI